MLVFDVSQYRSPNRLVDPKTGEFVDLWQTVAPFRVRLCDGREILIPEGFVFDKASVPRMVWWYLPRDDRRVIIAALVHDYLYFTQKIAGQWITRQEADELFYQLIRHAKMRYTKSQAAYWAIRAGGWVHFNKRAKTKRNPHYD